MSEVEADDSIEKLSDDPKVLKRKIKRMALLIQDLHSAGDRIEQLKEAEERIRASTNFVKATKGLEEEVHARFSNDEVMKNLILAMRNALITRKTYIDLIIDPDGLIRTFTTKNL